VRAVEGFATVCGVVTVACGAVLDVVVVAGGRGVVVVLAAVVVVLAGGVVNVGVVAVGVVEVVGAVVKVGVVAVGVVEVVGVVVFADAASAVRCWLAALADSGTSNAAVATRVSNRVFRSGTCPPTTS
jgi:hypothetical protein